MADRNARDQVHYRLYKPEDFEALYAIEEVCFHPPFRFGRRYMQRLVNAPNAAAWIAEDWERMAGFAIVEWASAVRGISGYIQTIEVSPEFRGQGIGSALLDRVEESSCEAGAGMLWLHVDESNATAIRLYEMHGFVRTGEEEDFYAPGRGALVYQKEVIREK